MIRITLLRLFIALLAVLTASCAIPPETQAKMDAYDNSIPICSSAQDCAGKWQIARNWAIENADFPILTESDRRIMASSTLTSNSGIGVVVLKQETGQAAGEFQLLVNVECFMAYGCPDLWDMKLDFNRTVAGR